MTLQTAYRSGATTRRDQFPIERYPQPTEAFYKSNSKNPDSPLHKLEALVRQLYTASGQAFSVIEEINDEKSSLLCTLNDNPRVQFLVEAEGSFITTQTSGVLPNTSQSHAGDVAIIYAMEDFARWVGRTCDGQDERLLNAIHRYTGNRSGLQDAQAADALAATAEANVVYPDAFRR